MRTNGTRTPITRLRQLAGRSGSGPVRAGANPHVVPMRAIVRTNGNGHRQQTAAVRRVQEAPDLQNDPRIQALRLIARQLRSLSWSPALLALLLDELYVDDLFEDVVGNPDTIPVNGYAHAVAVAIALRHSWRPDDLAAAARRLVDVAGTHEARATQSRSRDQRRPG